jgi:hypothetical protein
LKVEDRRLHLALGYSSLFTYCTARLRLSEASAYSRITAARLARRFTNVLDLLEAGALTLSGLGRLSGHLTEDNAASLFEAARFKSTRDIEKLVAGIRPEPAVPTTIRAVGRGDDVLTAVSEPSLLSSEGPPPAETIAANQATARTPVAKTRHDLGRAITRPSSAPLGADHFLLRVTISKAAQEKLERLQQLMRHRVPNGDMAVIIDEALALLLARVERERCGKARHRIQVTPRREASGPPMRHPHSRHIPAGIRRAVWIHDEGRCAFVGTDGRCAETAFLEIHHVRPFADGGPTTIDNLALRCRAHNGFEATLFFGNEWKKDGTLRAQS